MTSIPTSSPKRELARMFDWLVWAFIAYALVIVMRRYGVEPQLQIVLWKLGNLTIAAYAGYWIDRRAFSRIASYSTSNEQVRRAIVVGCAMLSVGLGL